MHTGASSSSPTTLQPISPAPARAAEESASAENQATTAFSTMPDAGSRFMTQLDGLTETLEKVTPPSRGHASPEAGSDEELESYLQKYMQQLTGKGQEMPVRAPAITLPQPQQPPVEESKARERQPAQAPEDRLRITAMREVANDSARRAMVESTQIQLIVKTRMTYLAAKAISLASSTLAIAYFPTRSVVALASATAFFGIACVLGCRFVGLCRELRRLEGVDA